MNRLLLVTILANALPLATPVLADDNDEVTPICRRSYIKLRLYLAPQQLSLGGGLNLGAGCPPQQYSLPSPQIYNPPPQYAAPSPQYTPPEPVCPPDTHSHGDHDILTKLAVLHYLSNHDARRDSRRDADDPLLSKEALLQLLQNRREGDGRDGHDGLGLTKEGLALLEILQNQKSQIGLETTQLMLLQEIIGIMQRAVPPGPTPTPYPYPETRPGSDSGSMRIPGLAPAPAPPPAPSGYRSAVPSRLGDSNRTFWRDTVFRR